MTSSGVIYFSDKEVTADVPYTVTVSKPGYVTASPQITIPDVPAKEPLTIRLTPDPAALIKQDTVTFGKYADKPITWRVLDIVESGGIGYALLLADEPIFNREFDADSNAWSLSDVKTMLNNKATTDGFLHSENFTAAEYGAIAAATTDGTGTGDRVFLLSEEEVLRYLPDNSMRKTGVEWWLRSEPLYGNYVHTVTDEGITDDDTDVKRGVRPAMWVNMTTAQFGYLVSGVTLNKTALSLTVGQTETLIATVEPVDATNKTVTWSSSNTAIVTVSNGVMTAAAVGTAAITVTTDEGNFTATCDVTVSASGGGPTYPDPGDPYTPTKPRPGKSASP